MTEKASSLAKPSRGQVKELVRSRKANTFMEDLFDENGWGDSRRNGIYDYVHYHSRIHEVLGIARAKARSALVATTARPSS
jgi:uncharacterized protein YjlB